MAETPDTPKQELVSAGGREVATRPTGGTPNPFQSNAGRTNISEGSVAIESSRAVAEAQASMLLARAYPRDEMRAFEKFMNACRRPTFAAKAFFKFPRGGQSVEGVTIRFAEEAARCWGNIGSGMAELSNKDGVTEMLAWAQDLESNVRSTQNFNVKHIRDKTGGAQALTDQRDVYEIGANMGSRRLRARILAVLPADYVEMGQDECKRTLAKVDQGTPLPERIKAMVGAFSRVGVTVDMLAARLGHPVDKTTPQELEDFRGILTAIREEMTTVAEQFSPEQNATGAAINAAAGQTGKKVTTGAGGPTAPKDKPKDDKPKDDEPKKDPPKEEAKKDAPKDEAPKPRPGEATKKPTLVPPPEPAKDKESEHDDDGVVTDPQEGRQEAEEGSVAQEADDGDQRPDAPPIEDEDVF